MKQHYFCFAYNLIKKKDSMQKFTDDWNFLPTSDFDYIFLDDNINAKKVDSVFFLLIFINETVDLINTFWYC
jgi:hypothetical protein